MGDWFNAAQQQYGNQLPPYLDNESDDCGICGDPLDEHCEDCECCDCACDDEEDGR